ncbi:MAG TPA: ABC transporter permease, partial [Vicinamibacterales bacterium]
MTCTTLRSAFTHIPRDLAYAARSLSRARAFTAVAVVTLALGIGANTAIFSIINAVWLRPLPFRDPGQLVFVWSSGATGQPQTLTPGRFVDLREQMASLEGMAGICQFGFTLTGGGDPEAIDGSSVSSNFFDVLGAKPLLGDTFHGGTADERAVVLSYGLWARRFGSDPAIVGRDITLNGTSRRVVAVMPREFAWPAITTQPSTAAGPELWIPGAVKDIPRTPTDRATEDLSANRGLGILRAVARLKAGVTPAQAQRDGQIVAARLASIYPASDEGHGVVVVPMGAQFFGAFTQPLLILLGAVAFVLAIACANVASLLLGRATSRRREIAIRLAIGASRARVVQQLLTESVLLSLTGAVAGLSLAVWLAPWFTRINPAAVRVGDIGVDGRVLVFTLLVAVFTGVVFGLAPAMQAAGGSPNDDLKDGGSRGGSAGPRARRTRDVLVAAEVAIALVLLVGAGLLLRSFSALSHVDTGIDSRNLLTFNISLPRDRVTTGPARAAFHAELLRRVSTIPGVLRAGAAVTLPIGGDTFSSAYAVEGAPAPRPGEEPSAGLQVITPGYFGAIGMHLVHGRDFTDSDTADAPAVVAVNQALAKQAWPGRDAIGRRMRTGADEPWLTVVAVVSDMRHGGPAAPPRPEFYQPLAQRPFSSMAFVVRTSGNPSAIVPAIRREAAALDPGLPVSKVATMDEHVARALSAPRVMSTLVAAFGALALALAIVGIYGVMSYAVTERTREIAIRAALGATRVDVLKIVVGRAMLLAACGVAAGLVGAALLSRTMAGMLFGIPALDVATFATASVALMAVALLAALVPAVRAMRVDGS